jgi:hypothetical protein
VTANTRQNRSDSIRTIRERSVPGCAGSELADLFERDNYLGCAAVALQCLVSLAHEATSWDAEALDEAFEVDAGEIEKGAVKAMAEFITTETHPRQFVASALYFLLITSDFSEPREPKLQQFRSLLGALANVKSVRDKVAHDWCCKDKRPNQDQLESAAADALAIAASFLERCR